MPSGRSSVIARPRAEHAEQEARRDGVVGLRLVDDAERNRQLLALIEHLADDRRWVARSRPLALPVAGLAGEKAAGEMGDGGVVEFELSMTAIPS
jgi:hypothetical protein